jgi:hypothetical protein
MIVVVVVGGGGVGLLSFVGAAGWCRYWCW